MGLACSYYVGTGFAQVFVPTIENELTCRIDELETLHCLIGLSKSVHVYLSLCVSLLDFKIDFKQYVVLKACKLHENSIVHE